MRLFYHLKCSNPPSLLPNPNTPFNYVWTLSKYTPLYLPYAFMILYWRNLEVRWNASSFSSH